MPWCLVYEFDADTLADFVEMVVAKPDKIVTMMKYRLAANSPLFDMGIKTPMRRLSIRR
jgi:hypothetical protein